MIGERLRQTRASMFHPTDWLDRVFEIGIIAKGLNGVAEVIGGLLLLFASPGRIKALAGEVTQGELSEDPHDVIATYLLHTTNGLTGDAVLFGAIYAALTIFVVPPLAASRVNSFGVPETATASAG